MTNAAAPSDRQSCCEKCFFFFRVRDPKNVADVSGNCLRNPPIGIPMATQGGIAVITTRPKVNGQEWCGEFATAQPEHVELGLPMDWPEGGPLKAK